MPLFGREKEVRGLHELLSEARSGRGRLVFLAGELGIGKTRLAYETGTKAQRIGFRFLSGRCYDRSIPFSPWIEMANEFQRLTTEHGVPRAENRQDIHTFVPPALAREFASSRQQEPLFLENVIGPAEMPRGLPRIESSLRSERLQILDSFTRFFLSISQREPIMLFLDDLNFADESSLLLLRYFITRIFSQPILLLGAYRDDELSDKDPLFNTLLDLKRNLCNIVKLKGLSVGETERFVAHILTGQNIPRNLANEIYELTRGNPFYVEEISRYLVEQAQDTELEALGKVSLPPTVKTLLQRRLEKYSETTLRMLSVGALIGVEFSPRIVSKVIGTGEDDVLSSLEDPTRAGLIRERRVESRIHFQFSDRRIIGYLRESLPTWQRQKIHISIAEGLEQLFSDRLVDFSDAIAFHYAEGANWRKAAEFWEKAAGKAEQLRAYDEAIQHYNRITEISADQSAVQNARFKIAELNQSLQTWTQSLRDITGIVSISGFDKFAHSYDMNVVPVFRTFAERIFSLAKLREGLTVLDIGTGTGLAALQAATIVGKTGKVLGIDLSEGMLTVAREKARTLGFANVEFQVMDETALQLPEENFAAVVSNLGMPVLNPDMAMREAYRVLAKGGTFCFDEWPQPNPSFQDKAGQIFDAAMEKHRTRTPSQKLATFRFAGNYRGRGFERLWDSSVLLRMLEKTGFKNIRVSTISQRVVFESVEQYLNYQMSWWIVASEMREMADPQLFRKEVGDQLAQIATDGRIEPGWQMNYFSAAK